MPANHTFFKNINEGVPVAWPADIRDEAVAAALLLPLAYQDVRWPVSAVTTASDATPMSEAVVTSLVHERLSHSLFASSEIVGAYTILSKEGLPRVQNPDISVGNQLITTCDLNPHTSTSKCLKA